MAERTRTDPDGVTVYISKPLRGAVVEQRGLSGRVRVVEAMRPVTGTCRNCGARSMRGWCPFCAVTP